MCELSELLEHSEMGSDLDMYNESYQSSQQSEDV